MRNHRKISAFAIASLLSASLFTMLGRNYIRTDVMLDSIGLSKMTSVKYYDGLGRLEQTVAVEASPLGADLIQHNSRDRAGNPVKNIDLKGDSVAVLYNQGTIGHLALLIQNAEGKWAYYSYNGTPIYENTKGAFGGKQYHDLGTKIFNSPEDFMNSTYNRKGNEEEVKNNKVNNF